MENIIANLFTGLTIFIFGAILVEKITEIIGNKFAKFDKTYVSMIVGIIVALYAKMNFIEMIGIPFGWGDSNVVLNYIGLAIGIVASGLVLSTGSNSVHDFFSNFFSCG